MHTDRVTAAGNSAVTVQAAVDRALAKQRAEATREVEAILDAALRVAERVTPAAPRVADIVAEAGISNQAFYRYFAGKDDLKDLVGGQTAIHAADAKQFLRSADRYLIDGDELEFGEFKVLVMHTPGHTPGSVSYVVANHAFVGDTILAGGIGKQTPETDLRRQMMSIGTKLLKLPLTTALYPGHGPATSLERELAQNPIFRGAGAATR